MRTVTLRGLLARKLRLALTALAIVLGVTFVTGTLVLGDTLNRTFDNLVGTAYQHVSFQVRGKAAFNNDTAAAAAARRSQAGPGVDAAAVRRVPGVGTCWLGRRLRAVHDPGRQRDRRRRRLDAGFSFDPNAQLSLATGWWRAGALPP